MIYLRFNFSTLSFYLFEQKKIHLRFGLLIFLDANKFDDFHNLDNIIFTPIQKQLAKLYNNGENETCV